MMATVVVLAMEHQARNHVLFDNGGVKKNMGNNGDTQDLAKLFCLLMADQRNEMKALFIQKPKNLEPYDRGSHLAYA